VSAGGVRVAQLADVPRLVALMSEFYAEAGYSLPTGPAARTFTQLLGDARLGRVWIAEWGGQPAGYVVLTVCFSMEYGGLHGFVDDLFVRSPFRGRGLAGAALGAVREACAELGVRALHVEVGPTNDAARRVYERSGFEASGRLLLTLPLAPPVHDS
jgi:GNAT superfamily N-acetyltransferase